MRGNRRQTKASRLEFLFCALQLAGLAFAKGSPSGRAEEKEHYALRTLERLVGLFMPKLVGERKWRCLLTDLQTHRKNNGMISVWILLATRSCKQSEKE